MNWKCNVTGFVADHPRVTNVLWTAVLLWSMTGVALASGGGATSGP
ncbi:DUF7503 family protein [Halorussus lipolyticus]|nr:hypothetical protein [Halorussus sp. DT80]